MPRFVMVAVLLLGLGAGTARSQTDDADIRGVISRQIEALQADDFATAFSFASPMIQRMFGSPSRFGAMVQNGYPMVWRPANIRFSGLATKAGRRVQSVVVTDQAGALYVLDYEMVPGEDGWRINGVMIRRSGEAGA